MDLPALSTDPVVDAFYDKRTGSLQYVVADPETKHCAIVDPVLDFEPKSGATATHSADALLRYVQSEGYVLDWVLDTHPHADHFSAAGYLKDKTGVRIAILRRSLRSRSCGTSSIICRISLPTARNGTGSSPMASGSISAT